MDLVESKWDNTPVPMARSSPRPAIRATRCRRSSKTEPRSKDKQTPRTEREPLVRQESAGVCFLRLTFKRPRTWKAMHTSCGEAYRWAGKLLAFGEWQYTAKFGGQRLAGETELRGGRGERDVRDALWHSRLLLGTTLAWSAIRCV